MSDYKVVKINWVNSQIALYMWCHIEDIPKNIAIVQTI